MKEEIWKKVKRYEGLYEVSNLGRIKRLDYFQINPKNKNVKCLHKGFILKTKIDRYGYETVGLRNKGKKYFTIHRLVAEAFKKGKTKNKNQVNHIDFNKLNNRVENLEWVSNQENRNHTVKNYRHNFGKKVNTAKLTEKQVKKIRTLYKKVSNKKLAEMFGVTPTNIISIGQKKIWKHL